MVVWVESDGIIQILTKTDRYIRSQIKGGVMAIFEIIRNAMLLGFGVQEKVREFVDEAVKRGELSESQGAKLVREWTDKAEKNSQDISNSINDLLSKTIEKMKLPTREDLDKANEQIAALTERIRKLEETKG